METAFINNMTAWLSLIWLLVFLLLNLIGNVSEFMRSSQSILILDTGGLGSLN